MSAKQTLARIEAERREMGIASYAPHYDAAVKSSGKRSTYRRKFDRRKAERNS